MRGSALARNAQHLFAKQEPRAKKPAPDLPTIELHLGGRRGGHRARGRWRGIAHCCPAALCVADSELGSELCLRV